MRHRARRSGRRRSPTCAAWRCRRHHDVRAADVNEKRLGAVLALAHERDLRDFASLLLLEQLGPRTLQSLALVAEVVHGTPTRFDRSGAILVRPRRQGRPSVSSAAEDLRRVDRGAAARARRGEARTLGETRRPVAARRVHAMDRAPAASPRRMSTRTIAHERAISPSLGGRTVFDDVRERRSKKINEIQQKLF